MKTYQIPVTWLVAGVIPVRAENLEAAIETVEALARLNDPSQLPDGCPPLPDTLLVDREKAHQLNP